MADPANPFAQFAPVEANPFRQFATDAILRAQQPKPTNEFGLDFTKPVAEIRKDIAALPGDNRKKALTQWADYFVKNENKLTRGADDVVRSLARGTPIGSWLDEANAATSAAANTLTGGAIGAPYDETVAYNRARDRLADKEQGWGGTALKVAGGIASLPFSPALRTAQGASMLTRVGAGAATGAMYGAAYGAGEGEDPAGRAVSGLTGAAIGAGVGAAAVPVAEGIGNAVKYVADKYRTPPAALAGYNQNAVRKTAEDMAADRLYQPNGGPQPPGFKTYADKAKELGQQGMLADMGDNLAGRAAGLANIPGQSKTIVRDALVERAASAPDRFVADANRVIGPQQNLVAVGENVTKATKDAAKPFYDQFYATDIKPTDRLIALVQRVPREAWAGAQKLAEAEGVDLRQVINTGRGIDLIKRGIDDIAGRATPGSNEQRVYGNLARAIRNEVDSLLSPNNPAMSSYSQARSLAKEGFDFNEALAAGGKVFDKNVHPDVLRAEVAGMTPAEQAALIYGARGRIRDAMGNATSVNTTAENNVKSMQEVRRLLGSDYAREKANMVLSQPVATPGPTRDGLPFGYQKLGSGNVDDVLARLDAETKFAQTQNTVTGNSVTAARQQTIKDMGPLTGNDAASEAGKMGIGGLAVKYGYKLGDMLLGGQLNASRAAAARDSARMLIAQGVERDALARALMDYGRARAVTTQQREVISRLAQMVLAAPRGAAISGQSEPK